MAEINGLFPAQPYEPRGPSQEVVQLFKEVKTERQRVEAELEAYANQKMQEQDRAKVSISRRTRQTGLRGAKAQSIEQILEFDYIISREVAHYNNKFHFPKPLTPEIIYGMILTEGGHGEALVRDPMQIANKGDHALKALASGREYTKQIGDFSYLEGIQPTLIRHWRRTYDPNMTPDKSIPAGIGWLLNKAAIRDENGNIIGWRSWEAAIKRYNGGGDHNYTEDYTKNKKVITNYLETGYNPEFRTQNQIKIAKTSGRRHR
jgi:hypothetical protein